MYFILNTFLYCYDKNKNDHVIKYKPFEVRYEKKCKRSWKEEKKTTTLEREKKLNKVEKPLQKEGRVE